jgi:hypothetical protein
MRYLTGLCSSLLLLTCSACGEAGASDSPSREDDRSEEAEESKTYLLSVVDLPARSDEQISSFHFDTWGVTFEKICHFPNSWSIEAGVGATPQGVFGGKGSVGASWFGQPSPQDLKDVALVSFWGPTTEEEIHRNSHYPGGQSMFEGTATVSTDQGDIERSISGKNIRIAPAAECP